MDFLSNRPPGFQGNGDRYLPAVIKKLTNYFKPRRKKLAAEIFPPLSNQQLRALSTALVEFSEDIHNDIGLWKSLEQYHREFFGKSLPLILPGRREMNAEAISPYRIQHFIWVLNSQINPDFIPAPNHPELMNLAEQLSEILIGEFKKIPADSGVKKFLEEPNEFGWQIKKKAVWMGTSSYLFRHCFQLYVEEHGGKPDIETIDDFICQETTEWSGLGVIDILAAVLKISEKRRSELRSWYERHTAIFKVQSIEPPMMKALNTFNEAPYHIRGDEACNFFKEGELILGSLYPCNNEWYWSGAQARLGHLAEKNIQELKDDFIQRSSNIVYRYRPDLVAKVKENLAMQYEGFRKYFGEPLVVFPNTQKLNEGIAKFFQKFNEDRARELGRKAPKPTQFSKPFSEAFKAVPSGKAGLFFNADEGMETMLDFGGVISGFQKKGWELSENEAEVIRQFIFSENISPNFISYMIDQYGIEAINAAFWIEPLNDKSAVEYMLRRYKGRFYRRRFPAVSIAGT